MDIRKICIKYDITDPYTYLENPLPKSQWKSLITKHVHQYWKNAIEENMLLYTSLKYLDSNYNIGRIHPLLKSQSANIQGIRRIPTRLKIVTGTYRQIELFIPHILFLQLVIYVEMQTKP